MIKRWRLPRLRTRRPSRQLKTTREGKLLIAITLGLGFGAINSGNNLLYLVLGMLLSLIVVSGVLSELTLRGLSVRRGRNGFAYAGQSTFLGYELSNTKKRASSFSVEAEELIEVSNGVSQRPGYGLFLRPGESVEVAARLSFVSRGVYASTGIRLATRFPFSFFRKWRIVEAPFEFTVFPKVIPVVAPGIHAMDSGAYESHAQVGRGGEYYGLREHRLEDDPRDIHWKTTAKLGRLVAREYEALACRQVWLIVPNQPRAGGSVGGRMEPAEAEIAQVEEAISHAASLAIKYLNEGWSVGLWTYEARLEPATGDSQQGAILRHLARMSVFADAVVEGNRFPTGETGLSLLIHTGTHCTAGLPGVWDAEYHPKRGGVLDASEDNSASRVGREA